MENIFVGILKPSQGGDKDTVYLYVWFTDGNQAPSDPRSVDTLSLSNQTDRFPEYQQTLVMQLPVLNVSLAKDVATTLLQRPLYCIQNRLELSCVQKACLWNHKHLSRIHF